MQRINRLARTYLPTVILLFSAILMGLFIPIYTIGKDVDAWQEINSQMAKGVVFVDANMNGEKDRGEKGIVGIAVSNGVDVVQTNEAGEYALPYGDDNIIFVIKPANYTYAVDENNLPSFYYIHKPHGSPKLTYSGVAPTGKLPASVDFGLLPYAENTEFKILVFGDPQPRGMDELYYFEKSVVEELIGVEGVSFGISLGDNVSDFLDLNKPYIQAIKQIGVPWHHVVGNHDINKDAKVDSLSDETFESFYGPPNYSFNYGNVHFIVLDNILYPDPRGGAHEWGGFREDQLQFVENDLRLVDTSKLIVVSMHIPLLNDKSFRDTDRHKLFDLLKDYPHTLVLSGHTHVQRQNFYDKNDGWYGEKPLHEYNVGAASGNWNSGELNDMGVPDATMADGTPRGYAYVSFKDNQYLIDYKVSGKPEDYKMEIFAPYVIPTHIPHNRQVSSRIYVNFFIGKKGDLVEYRIGEGEWKKMRYTEDYDPTYLNLLHRWDYTPELMLGRRPSHPVKSSHLWMAPIGSGLPVGKHAIEVKVTDMFGRIFSQKKEVRVAKPKQVSISERVY